VEKNGDREKTEGNLAIRIIKELNLEVAKKEER
jgi:hypothetical protein